MERGTWSERTGDRFSPSLERPVQTHFCRAAAPTARRLAARRHPRARLTGASAQACGSEPLPPPPNLRRIVHFLPATVCAPRQRADADRRLSPTDRSRAGEGPLCRPDVRAPAACRRAAPAAQRARGGFAWCDHMPRPDPAAEQARRAPLAQRPEFRVTKAETDSEGRGPSPPRLLAGP